MCHLTPYTVPTTSASQTAWLTLVMYQPYWSHWRYSLVGVLPFLRATHRRCADVARPPRRAADRRAGDTAVGLPAPHRRRDQRPCGGESAAGGAPPASGRAPRRWRPETRGPLCTTDSRNTPAAWR